MTLKLYQNNLLQGQSTEDLSVEFSKFKDHFEDTVGFRSHFKILMYYLEYNEGTKQK